MIRWLLLCLFFGAMLAYAPAFLALFLLGWIVRSNWSRR